MAQSTEVRQKNEAQGDTWVSMHAAAALSGKSKQTLLSLALDGRVVQQKVGGRRFFDRAEMEALAATDTSADETE